jgi:hypothetical protein
MRRRYRGSLVALAASIAITSIASTGIGGQAQSSAKTNTGMPTRTPWGEPDLQGIWTIETVTPLERPQEFAGKEFLTEQEAAAFEAQTVASRVDVPPRAGDPGTYNQFWFDRGTKVVQTRRTSLIVDPPDGRIPWSSEGQASRKRLAQRPQGPFDSWVDLDTGERCLTDGLAMVPLQQYNMNYHVLQSPGYLVIQHEMFHDFRIIPTDGRPHAGIGIRQWLGDARGRWEGNTLVVETTNFADKTHYRWSAPWRASRPTLRLVERFTRVDADTIDYRVTIEDPAMFARPWTAAVPMSKNQAERGVTRGRLYEYACHEGNHSMINVLSGARAAEKASVSATGNRR